MAKLETLYKVFSDKLREKTFMGSLLENCDMEWDNDFVKVGNLKINKFDTPLFLRFQKKESENIVLFSFPNEKIPLKVAFKDNIDSVIWGTPEHPEC